MPFTRVHRPFVVRVQVQARHRWSAAILSIVTLIAAGCRGQQNAQPSVEQKPGNQQNDDAARELEARAARFAPVDLSADLSAIPDNERQALKRLVLASKIIDALFLRQVWAGNEAMLLDLVRDRSALGNARLHYFILNKGPWSRLAENGTFIPGAPPKPPQANFYPAGATKDEVD